MSGPPRVKSMNQAEPEVRPVLGPAGNNKSKSTFESPRKPLSKSKVVSANKMQETDEKKSPVTVTPEKDSSPSPKKKFGSAATTVLRQQKRQEVKLFSNLSMNASCSSDASTDSSQSRASTGRGRVTRRSVTPTPIRRKQQCGPKIGKLEKFEKMGCEFETLAAGGVSDDFVVAKKRCAWVTPNSGNFLNCSAYPLPWLNLHGPSFSTKGKHLVFQNFDPVAVSKLNEKKIAAPGSPASSLLSEFKLRAILENARQTCKIIEEFGSFEKYIWGFVNHKPIASHFRYPRLVPIKTSKAEAISKDLVRRGFRGIGPTVVYSFMQVAGITNDHLISCFRCQDCMAVVDGRDKDDNPIAMIKGKQLEDAIDLGLERTIDGLSLSI